MSQPDLDSYFDILNNRKKYTNYFEQGKRIDAVDGRWKNNTVQYQIKIGSTPNNINNCGSIKMLSNSINKLKI